MVKYVKASETKKKFRVYFTDGTDTMCTAADDIDAIKQGRAYLKAWSIDAKVDEVYEILADGETDLLSLWAYACNGNIRKLEQYYSNGGEVGIKYPAFGKDHSLIMGAVRNNELETAIFLAEQGETVSAEELEELKNTNRLSTEDELKLEKLINLLGRG